MEQTLKLSIHPNIIYCVIKGQVFKLNKDGCYSFVKPMIQYSELIIHCDGTVLKTSYSLERGYGTYMENLLKNSDIPLTEGKSSEEARHIYITACMTAERLTAYNDWRNPPSE